MDLYIYNQAIALQGVVDGFSSLRWRRRYYAPGEFELHCPATADNVALLSLGNIIHRLDRDEAGIIEGITIEGTDGGDEITVTGRMGSSLIDCRVITPTISFSGTVENAMRKIVSGNCITARPLLGLVLGAPGGYAPTCTFQLTGKNCLTACKALSRAAALGFRVRLDVQNRQWVFEAYSGTDRSVLQTERPYVAFSDDYSNITGAKYSADTTGSANYAYVAGQGDGNARVIVEVDRAGTAPRRELWVDQRDTQQDAEHGETLEAYKTRLAQIGAEKLAETVKSQAFEASAINTENFAYLTDWNLGDIVTFEKWGIRLDQRVTEVEEVYENGVETITPVCGNPLPEKLDFGSDD